VTPPAAGRGGFDECRAPAIWAVPAGRRIHGEHVTHNQVVKEHPDGGQVLFHARNRQARLQFLDTGRDPVFAPLRGEPRFASLLARMGRCEAIRII